VKQGAGVRGIRCLTVFAGLLFSYLDPRLLLHKHCLFSNKERSQQIDCQLQHTMASMVNASFASPLADATYPALSDGGLLSRAYNGVNGLSVFVTFVIMLVAYDQCELCPVNGFSIDPLTLYAVMYVWNKGSIVGPAWKTPFIGPFLSSVNPKMDEYKAKWASGELSCVSVFHKYGNAFINLGNKG
jgi:hypothetical protein